MKVLDLFCGLKGWSKPWVEAGHDVVTLDFDAQFEPTVVADILKVSAGTLLNEMGGFPDVILASPPCETFSVASIGHHWTGGARAYVPKTPEAETGKRIVERTVEIITHLNPRKVVIENPRGVLRKLDLIPWTRNTVWYCHYGDTRAKPTDLWTYGFAMQDNLCHNNRGHADDCCCSDHEKAPRGARTGTQGPGSYAVKSEIPEGLAKDIMKRMGG